MAKGQAQQAEVQPALPTPTAHRPPPQAPRAPPTARPSPSPPFAARRALPRALPECLLCVCLQSMIQPPSFHGVVSISRPVLMLLCMLLALGLCASG